METNEEALARIIAGFNGGMNDSRKAQEIAKKIAEGRATHKDAYEFARESGRIMTGSMKKNVPEVLTDGKMFREEADEVIRKPMKIAGKKVSKTAAEIQRSLNQREGIGINGIEVDLNDDQLTGIITGIANAESYEQGAGLLFDQLENFLEGVVDDSVRENAQFQYEAGLEPRVIRTASGKCCKWCSNLAGTYKYEDVRDKGNDVWRRHRNCHCTIEFDPGKKNARRAGKERDRSLSNDRDPAKIEGRKGPIKPDLQMFGGKGDYRAAMYQDQWQKASLKGTVKSLTPGAKKTENRKAGKIFYEKEKGRYQVVYDRKGDYFRIYDKQARHYVGINGESVLNKTVNGKTTGRSQEEFESLTHFKNSDKEGRR